MGRNAAKFFEALPGRNLIAGYPEDFLTAAADCLKNSQRPVIVCGTDICPFRGLGLQRILACFCGQPIKTPACFTCCRAPMRLVPDFSPNDHASLLNIIEAIENGEVKSLILVESDPFFHFPDRRRLGQALDMLDLLIVLDYLDSECAAKSGIFLCLQPPSMRPTEFSSTRKDGPRRCGRPTRRCPDRPKRRRGPSPQTLRNRDPRCRIQAGLADSGRTG